MIRLPHTERPPKVAEHLLDELLAHDDEHGALANAQADDLRDALRLACDRLRVARWEEPRGPWLIGARRLVAEVWKLVIDKRIDSRSPAADAALDLRDMIDTKWWPDAEAERKVLRGEGERASRSPESDPSPSGLDCDDPTARVGPDPRVDPPPRHP